MRGRVRLAGEIDVETEVGRVRSTDLPGRQGRLVFARLAATPYPVSRDELAELVWPDRLPKSWERDLSAVVSKIRALLIAVGYEDPVANAFGCYQLKLGPDVRIDVFEAREFLEDGETALRKGDLATAQPAIDTASNHFQRPLLPGEEGEWVEARRAEWHELLLRALDALIGITTQRGDLDESRRQAEVVIGLEPYRETGYAGLMRAHLAAGDRAAALKVYERARERFVEALGISPGPVLEAAYQEALAADPDTSTGGSMPRGTVTLLFTDIVGSVALGERLGHDADQAMRREHFERLRRCLAVHDGYEVKNLGDGLMVAFATSAAAVDASVAMQTAMADTPDVVIRIGIHAGEPVIEGDDYFGRCVAIARRLCDSTDGGTILVSDVVQALSSRPERFVDRQEVVLKGMSIPTTTWRVRPEP